MSSRSLISMIESLEPGVVILNSDHSISHINRMFFLMFGGIPVERLFQTDILGFHHEKDRAKVGDMLRLAGESKRQIPLSLKMIRHDGLDRYLLIKLTPLVNRDMVEDQLCATFYDITQLILSKRKLFRVPVTSNGDLRLLKPEEIIYIKADNIYAQIYAESGEYHCGMAIGSIAKRLPDDSFFRTHRSYLINISKVIKVNRERLECTVNVKGRDLCLPISRNKLQEFLVEIGIK
ncbi:LytTR family transcriptional regulator DNA-binding domain-containing protein [Geoalkalibacter subterraneus]|uniref:Histidine kinase n=1 Tax=Geoalkalibacter subterraneus TaxID=483547 RepID=A0A0B5FQ34_9BACT|nr:LytTR family transcriptional regulator DNA-binding domain-containing protein [Geoalkalibacter subterraneus]AJF06774.1 histidine kinase [Geoalkalibacter subterraneus]